ncbi:MAG: MarR family winged helix-turn-helix transcriptional regulator [Thermodesulfobacteriota bacterium]|nr:MarR family winged helix-turn-helix transcriptional regulator [Thermodesulfobacteriota bacterium]
MNADLKNIQSHPDPQVPKGSYDLRILQSLRRIIRAVDIHSRKLATQHKITGPQLACLMVVKEEAPLMSGHLAKKVYLSPSTVVGIVDRLEEKKMVVRNRSSKDRRQVYISITSKGEQLIADAPSLLQDTLAEGLVKLPEIEQVSITMALEKLVDLMEVCHIEASPVLETGSLSSEK